MSRKVFLDLETTGLSPIEEHRVIEIGAVVHSGDLAPDEEQGKFHRLLNPQREVEADAEAIHGYNYRMLMDKERFEDVAGELASFLEGCELIAHNASFDVPFLDMEFAKVGMPKVEEMVDKVTDTLEMASKMFPGSRVSLDALAKRARIDLVARRPRHGALIDAEILADVYAFLTGGQTELGLQEDSVKFAADLPEAKDIKIHPLQPDPRAAKLHREYLEAMHKESRVRPMGLEPGNGA